MEYEENGEQPGFWERLKESPRTVSALIIILIIAAGIYAFSGDEAAVTQEGEEMMSEEEVAEEADEETEELVAATPTATLAPVDQQSLTEEVLEELPQAEVTGEGYMETAQTGDGMTHLARRAAARWLSENQTDYQITNEHRIFIEDYVQKKMGSPRLGRDEQKTISFGLIEEAVTAAGQLNDRQLRNLSQYTHALA